MRLFPDSGPDIALDLVDSRADSTGVTIQVYRPTGRPQYASSKRVTSAATVSESRSRETTAFVALGSATMKGEALWARPCIRGRTGILELEPKVSECADTGAWPAGWQSSTSFAADP